MFFNRLFALFTVLSALAWTSFAVPLIVSPVARSDVIVPNALVTRGVTAATGVDILVGLKNELSVSVDVDIVVQIGGKNTGVFVDVCVDVEVAGKQLLGVQVDAGVDVSQRGIAISALATITSQILKVYVKVGIFASLFSGRADKGLASLIASVKVAFPGCDADLKAALSVYISLLLKLGFKLSVAAIGK